MTEQNTSGAVVALPSIGDSAVLAEILMYTGRDAIAVMLNEQGDPNDFSRIVFGVASIFMGHTDSLELPEGWDPAARGAALRPLLSDMLENMPEEDRRTLSLIHISEPTRRTPISYAVFCLKKKNTETVSYTHLRAHEKDS